MLILGIDEVGRGSWAGPLAVGAVVLNSENSEKLRAQNLKDSKKLTKIQREKLAREIKKSAIAIGVGWIDAKIIDKIGLSESLKLAAENAFFQIPREIREKIDQIVIDGTVNFLAEIAENNFAEKSEKVDENSRENLKNSEKIDENFAKNLQKKIVVLPRADDKIAAVSAASIIAKVFRDDYMAQISPLFPQFNFAKNVGYGTKIHAESLAKFGAISGIHRASFAPIRKILNEKNAEKINKNLRENFEKNIEKNENFSRENYDILNEKIDENFAKSFENSNKNFDKNSQNNFEKNTKNRGKNLKTIRGKNARNLGYLAENVAAEFLENRGHKIISRNWKTKFCEIDIISAREKILYFTEVKFRENANFGDGIDAITRKKLRQMKKSAEIFLAVYGEFSRDFDVRISAISLSKNPPKVDEFLENVW